MQVIDETTGDILYCVRASGNRFQPHVFSAGTYTVKVGRDSPDGETLTGLTAQAKASAGERTLKL